MSAEAGSNLQPKTTFVDLDTAKAAAGLRLVVAAGIPSPWSEAAKGILHMARIPFVAVRMPPRDASFIEWTKVRNVPVAMFEREPPRSGWAEILELAARLAPEPRLVPMAPADRVRMFGLAHEIMGEGGLLWCGRVLTIDRGLTSDGARGFPLPVAKYLASRYGHDRARLDVARKRIDEGWALLDEALGKGPYFFGDRPHAIDVYAAAAVNIFVVPPEEQCAMLPLVRAAFESMRAELSEVPRSLVALRDRMYERHLELPIVV